MAIRRLLTFILSLIWSVSCFAEVQNRKLVVLFTADLHSQVLPDNQGRGGFAKIASLVSGERELAQKDGAAFILVDGGDISMGSVFHTLFESHAIEYRGMARIGYDAVAVGNHAFDFGSDAFVQMVANARLQDSALVFPKLLSANLQCRGIQFDKYTILERNGLRIGVFGLMGENSFNVVGKGKSDLVFSSQIEAAKEIVKILQPQTDYIIAVSHGGTANGDDIKLAKKVCGIDFIVSAHDHEVLDSPVYAGGIPVGAPGSNAQYVGKAVFDGGKLMEYTLLAVDNDVPADAAMECWIDSMYNVVGEEFKKLSGRRLDDTLAFLSDEYPLTWDEDGKMVLGTNIAAGYRNAAIANLPDVPSDKIVGVVPYGVVRKGLDKGAVTNRDVFEVLSLGENECGRTGYPLVYAWVTGKELEDLCEMSVSIAPILEDTRVFFSGLNYRYNGAGFPFMRVDRVKVGDSVAKPDSLYMVVTGWYTAQLIGLLESESYGILSAVAKDSSGNPLQDGFMHLRDGNGSQIAEWEAFAQYLQLYGFDPQADEDSVENDDFVPLGYTLGAILICAAILYFMRKRD